LIRSMSILELSAEQIAQLQAIETTGLQPGRYAFPDFLIVGPQRTGTTWMFRNLKHHPQVFLPVEKELYFFNKLAKSRADKFRSRRLEWYSEHFTPDLKTQLARQARNLKQVGRIGKTTRQGEATATYAVMDEALIREIAVLRPAMRIVFGVRHPVSRAWSDVKRILKIRTAEDLEQIGFEKFCEVCSSDYQMRCARYGDALDRWLAIFGEEQVLTVVLEDEIAARPKETLASLCRFLGVDDAPSLIDRLVIAENVNPTQSFKMPAPYREYLVELLAEPIRAANERFGTSYA